MLGTSPFTKHFQKANSNIAKIYLTLERGCPLEMSTLDERVELWSWTTGPEDLLCAKYSFRLIEGPGEGKIAAALQELPNT